MDEFESRRLLRLHGQRWMAAAIKQSFLTSRRTDAEADMNDGWMDSCRPSPCHVCAYVRCRRFEAWAKRHRRLTKEAIRRRDRCRNNLLSINSRGKGIRFRLRRFLSPPPFYNASSSLFIEKRNNGRKKERYANEKEKNETTTTAKYHSVAVFSSPIGVVIVGSFLLLYRPSDGRQNGVDR